MTEPTMSPAEAARVLDEILEGVETCVHGVEAGDAMRRLEDELLVETGRASYLGRIAALTVARAALTREETLMRLVYHWRDQANDIAEGIPPFLNCTPIRRNEAARISRIRADELEAALTAPVPDKEE